MTGRADRFRSGIGGAIIGAVAAGYLALALADGGFAPESLAALTIATWTIVIVGLARGALPRAPVSTPALLSGIALAGLALLTAASISYSSDPGGAFEDLVRLAAYLGLFTLVVMVASPGSGRGWLLGLAIGLGAVAVIALAGRVLVQLPGDAALYEQLPAAQGLLSFPIGYWNGLAACMAALITLLAWLSLHLSSHAGRVRALVFLPIPILVIYLASSRGGALAALAGFAVLVWAAPDRHRQIGVPMVGIIGGLILVAFVSTLGDLRAAADTADAEREGILALGAILLVCAGVSTIGERGVWLIQSFNIPKLSRPQALLSGGLIGLGAILALGPGGLLDAFQDPVISSQAGSSAPAELSSAAGRYQYWEAALGAFASNPVQGIGSSGFEVWWNLNGDLPRTVSQVHSLFLESLAELGIPGLVLVLAFFAAPLRLSYRAARNDRGRLGVGAGEREAEAELEAEAEDEVEVPLAGALVALLVGGFVIASLEWTWDIPAAIAPVIIAAALACSVLASDRPTPVVIPGRHRLLAPLRGAFAGRPGPPGFGAAISTAAVGLVAIGAGLTLLSTEDHLSASESASLEGRFAAAAREAREAAVLQPWAVEPRQRLAQLEQEAGNLDAARLELDAAIERAPEDFALWLLFADLQRQLGNDDVAQIARDRAEALNPRSPLFRGADAPG